MEDNENPRSDSGQNIITTEMLNSLDVDSYIAHTSIRKNNQRIKITMKVIKFLCAWVLLHLCNVLGVLILSIMFSGLSDLRPIAEILLVCSAFLMWLIWPICLTLRLLFTPFAKLALIPLYVIGIGAAGLALFSPSVQTSFEIMPTILMSMMTVYFWVRLLRVIPNYFFPHLK